MRAMILAAGLGTRLRPLTHAIPKPLIPVANRPVMEHIVRLVAGHGLNEVIANLSHLPDQIREHFGDGGEHGIALTYSDEQALLGTAGGVRNCAGFLGDSFLVISGDALTDIDLAAMRRFHESHDGIATLALKRVAETSEYGVVITGEDGRIQGFQEKPDSAEALSDLANCGIYMFRSEIFDFFPAPGESRAAKPDDAEGFADWALDVFPALLEADVPFYGHEIDAYWNDIGNLEELRQGNFDAIAGRVGLELPEGAELGDGVRAGPGTSLDGAEVNGPALIGRDCKIGSGVRIEGPLVIGDGCTIGEGAMLRESVLLDGAQVPPGAILAAGVLAVARV
ncbi:MAG: mannose-phosphate guanylyltransferase [Solirubrobacterales bacterium]|jgi:mannose-1-phosphate guanylyltransferase/mannose-1-phosphate guanylyltransferase/phosphomannomutase|nr:mannose-phosphate guanylyltransferase [Solirubrobacterales bacterium]